MYYSLKGRILKVMKDAIALDVNNVGYYVYISKVDSLTVGQELFILTYLSIRDNEQNLYGFYNEEERNIFLKLIEVSGVGPKTALQVLNAGGVDDLINAINSNNLKYFKTVSGVGPKTASQIIFALQGVFSPKEAQSPQVLGAFEIVAALGFKTSEIKTAYESAKPLITNEMNEKQISMIILRKLNRG